jgi:parallel beta-helix repeat protein
MTDRYFDWFNGSDSDNDGLSPTTPWKSYDAKRANIQTSDSVWIRRGTPQYTITSFMDVKSGVAGAPTTYGVYGEAQVPYCHWLNPSGSGNMILNFSGRSYVTIQDMYFDGYGTCQYSLYMFANGSTACVGHKVARCYFTNMKSGEAGLNIGGTATSTGETSDYLIEDNHFFKNPGHGMLLNGVNHARVRRNKFYQNGFDAQFGAHGFSSKARRTDATSGWTNTSGSIWQRNLAAYETAVYYVKSSLSPYQRLNPTAGTQTAPGLGEFGVSGGVLYVNIGTDPTTRSINYAWGRCYNLTIEDNESYENVADPRSPATEGHGFAFDDYADSSVFRGNSSHHNAGAGYSTNRGDNNTLEGNIAYRNGLSGVVGAACKNTKIWHNTLYDNNQSGEQRGEITYFTNAEIDFRNNSLKRGSSRGPFVADIDTTCTLTGDGNNVHGYDQIVRYGSSSLTNTTTYDPLLTDAHMPQAKELIRSGRFIGCRDFNGKRFYNPASIGAVEQDSPRSRLIIVKR